MMVRLCEEECCRFHGGGETGCSETECHMKWLQFARDRSRLSLDPSTKVGCVIVKDRSAIGAGHNALPMGMKCDERVNDREWKYNHIVHAEINALIDCAKRMNDPRGAILYVWPLAPCVRCAAAPDMLRSIEEMIAMAHGMVEEAGGTQEQLMIMVRAQRAADKARGVK